MGRGLQRARDAAKATRPPTPNEIRFLAGLAQPNPADGHRRLSWWTVPELRLRQPERFGDRSAQGLHETAASCVRKGVAVRRKLGGLPVEYQLADPYQAGNCEGAGKPWLPAGHVAGRPFPAMCAVCNAPPVMLRVPDPGPGENPLVPDHPDMVVWSGRVDMNTWRQVRATRDPGGDEQ